MHKSRYARIFILLLVTVIVAGIAGCHRKKPGEPVKISAPKGRLAFGNPKSATGTGDLFSPDLAIDATGKVNIAYVEEQSGTHRVFYVFSEDGEEFSHFIQLSDKDGHKSGGMELTSVGDSLVALWINETDVGAKLSYRRSTDNGKTFSRETIFNAEKNPMRYAVAGTDAMPLTFYIYEDGQTTSLAMNRNFNPDDESILLENGLFKDVRALNGGASVFMLAGERSQLSPGMTFRLLRSDDGGGTFDQYFLFDAKPVNVFKSGFDMAATSGSGMARLHMIWMERSEDRLALMYARSLGSITEWSAPLELASVTKIEDWLCSRPLLATDGAKRVFIAYAYQDDAGEREYRMAYRLSEDEGENFYDESYVTDQITSPETITGAITPGGIVHIAWDDVDKNDLAQKRIYYIKGDLR